MKRGLDFSGYGWISGSRVLSENNKNDAEVHFECDFALSAFKP